MAVSGDGFVQTVYVGETGFVRRAYLAIQHQFSTGLGELPKSDRNRSVRLKPLRLRRVSPPRPSDTVSNRWPSCLTSCSQLSPSGGLNDEEATRKRISAGKSARTAAFGNSMFGILART